MGCIFSPACSGWVEHTQSQILLSLVLWKTCLGGGSPNCWAGRGGARQSWQVAWAALFLGKRRKRFWRHRVQHRTQKATCRGNLQQAPAQEESPGRNYVCCNCQFVHVSRTATSNSRCISRHAHGGGENTARPDCSSQWAGALCEPSLGQAHRGMGLSCSRIFLSSHPGERKKEMRLSFLGALGMTILLLCLSEHFLGWQGIIPTSCTPCLQLQQETTSLKRLLLSLLSPFCGDVIQIGRSWKPLKIGQRNQGELCLMNCVPVISWGRGDVQTEQSQDALPLCSFQLLLSNSQRLY